METGAAGERLRRNSSVHRLAAILSSQTRRPGPSTAVGHAVSRPAEKSPASASSAQWRSPVRRTASRYGDGGTNSASPLRHRSPSGTWACGTGNTHHGVDQIPRQQTFRQLTNKDGQTAKRLNAHARIFRGGKVEPVLWGMKLRRKRDPSPHRRYRPNRRNGPRTQISSGFALVRRPRRIVPNLASDHLPTVASNNVTHDASPPNCLRPLGFVRISAFQVAHECRFSISASSFPG